MTAEAGVYQWIIDAIEENVAAIEVDGSEILFVPVFLLPKGAREGDVLQVRHERGLESSKLAIELDDGGKRALLDRSTKQAESREGKDRGGNVVL